MPINRRMYSKKIFKKKAEWEACGEVFGPREEEILSAGDDKNQDMCGKERNVAHHEEEEMRKMQ